MAAKSKVLITGISGFAGSHLAEYLVSQKRYSVAGTYVSEKSLKNIALIQKEIYLIKLNLKEEKKTKDAVAFLKPDFIFHLAALPAVGSSLNNPSETIINNITAQLNLLEAVRQMEFINCRILVVSSADVYGKVSTSDLPINENTSFHPTNAYAVSKIAQDFLGLQYHIAYHLKIIRVRPFNHIGPRQSTGFAVADFAKKIADIEKKKCEPFLKVGNLDTKRDFTDVRDMVRAYEMVIKKGEEGEVYNIGSGVSHSMLNILNKFLSLSKVKIKVEVDRHLFRPEDSPDRICDNRKFVRLTGWEPLISLEKSLKDTLDYWRNID